MVCASCCCVRLFLCLFLCAFTCPCVVVRVCVNVCRVARMVCVCVRTVVVAFCFWCIFHEGWSICRMPVVHGACQFSLHFLSPAVSTKLEWTMLVLHSPWVFKPVVFVQVCIMQPGASECNMQLVLALACCTRRHVRISAAQSSSLLADLVLISHPILCWHSAAQRNAPSHDQWRALHLGLRQGG